LVQDGHGGTLASLSDCGDGTVTSGKQKWYWGTEKCDVPCEDCDKLVWDEESGEWVSFVTDEEKEFLKDMYNY